MEIKMQTPNSFGNGPQGSLMFKDDMIVMPGGAQMVPPENQEPHARQYCLGNPAEQMKFEELLGMVFQKKAIIWSMDKNWTKEGDCMVVVFYSLIVKKSKTTGSDEFTTIGDVSPEVFEGNKHKKSDKLFDEFVKYMEDEQKALEDDSEIE